jgi:glycosyltransferase involved in cell wall biosynthesis
MQKTSFPIEVFVQDDASIDQTAEIIKGFAERFNFIIPIFHNENYFSQGKSINEFFFKNAKGKYIAICEGDDYWTDPYKLQKQVDFLEANTDFSISFHNLKVIYDDGKLEHFSNTPDQKEVSTIEDLAKGNYIYTASCLYRNGLINEFPTWFSRAQTGDYIIHMLNAKHGKIKYFNEVMGVYRVHKDGLWENRPLPERLEAWVDLLDIMKDHFEPQIRDILIDTQNYHFSELIKSYADNPEKCKYYSMRKIANNPFFIADLYKEILELKQKNSKILNSKIYKTGSIVLSPYSLLKKILNARSKRHSS